MTATGCPPFGIWMFPDAPAPEFVASAVQMEADGIDELWIGDEGPARDPFTLAGAVAARTTTLRIGLGVTNAYVRHPAITAATAMTVHELSGGRFVLGIGPGGDLSFRPLKLDRPRTPLQDAKVALATMRAVTRGEPGPDYEPASHAFTRPDLPIYVGSRGEHFNRWASAEADGAFVAGIAPSQVAAVVAWARAVRPIKVSVYLSACVLPEEVDLVRPRMVHGFLNSPPELRARAGLALPALQAASDALAAGDPGPASALLPDDVLGLLLLQGSPEALASELATHVRALRPDSIGLSLITDRLDASLDRAAAVASALRKELA